MAKIDENYMTIAEAKAFVKEVCAIVEREYDGGWAVRTYQHRVRGKVWQEGVSVDLDYDEGQGTFINTRTISYGVRCHEDDIAFIRKQSMDGNYIGENVPFFGTAQQAADYLLEEFRTMFEN